MDVLAALRVFVRVAEARSFSAVAREMGTTQPAVSRQVAALEEHLGARLIQRTTRSLALTEDGRDLLGHARRVLDNVEEAEASVGRRHSMPGGLVRLGSSSTFGRLYVAPRIPRLLERYPELAIELRMSDGISDLVAEGIDVAIRVGAVQDSSLVARKIGSSRRIAVASADCIAAYGEPQHPSELGRMPCVLFIGSATPAEWHFEGPEGPVLGQRPPAVSAPTTERRCARRYWPGWALPCCRPGFSPTNSRTAVCSPCSPAGSRHAARSPPSIQPGATWPRAPGR